MDQEWLPQQRECRSTYETYLNGKSRLVQQCAPTYYDKSCEKACIEKQASTDGCGVVEGFNPGEMKGMGGIDVNCAPLQPSWVMGPFTHGGQESAGAQCTRILAHQKA